VQKNSKLSSSQPAGVGFSSVNNGSLGGPSTLLEAAIDFEKVLFTIFSHILPQFSHQPLHLASESYGGHYAPYFTKYIHERRKMEAQNALPASIRSIILVDAVLDITTSGVGGQYEHFCARDVHGNIKEGGFNETACAAMERDTPACERLVRNCIESYDRNLCTYAEQFCVEGLGKWFDSDVIVGGRDPYDDRKKCKANPPICEDFTDGPLISYLNQPYIQDALGFKNHTFKGVNFDINDRFTRSGDVSIPTTREVTYLLDETETEVLVLNGNNDIIVNTEGQIRVYDALPWSKQALYRLQSFVDWVFPSVSDTAGGIILAKGGRMKKAGKLSFFTVDHAGHTSPGDAPESVAFIVQCWVSGRVTNGISCP
jgi:cathepsin A (carboxypeptidase C)